MIKSSIIIAAIFATSVAAYAAIAPEARLQDTEMHVTVIYKNEVWPILGPVVVENCRVEDCSDTPENTVN